MFKLVVHHNAAKYLKKLSENKREKIKKTLTKLSNDPFEFKGIKTMVGEWQGYQRVRIGDFRVIFWINKDENVIYVDYIGSRGDVYK